MREKRVIETDKIRKKAERRRETEKAVLKQRERIK
jgi:hypothetical protein